jgi:undecaprenyl-diphosphatase
MKQLLDLLSQVPPWAVYPLAALIVASETATLVGLVLPGEATLLLVGFLCYEGTLRLPLAIPVMIATALVADSVGFWEGRRNGPRLRENRLGRWVGPRRWQKTDNLFQRYGWRAVFIGRFVAFARTLTPRLVGMSGMPYREFLLWNALGVAGGVGGALLLGYVAGRSYATVADVLGQATGAVFLLVLVIVGLVLVGRYLGRHPDPVAAVGNRLAGWRPLRYLGWAYRTGFEALTRRIGVGGAVAVNVLGGVLVLLGVGYLLTLAVDSLVRGSGLPLVDPLVMTWVSARREPGTMRAAVDTLSVLRGTFLAVLTGLTGLVLNWRSRVWRADLVGVIGTVGAFVPLLLIAVASSGAGASTPGPSASVLPNQTVVATASLGMLAWLLSRRLLPHRFGWGMAVTAWTVAFGGVIVVGAARVYVGWSWPSETVASALLGGLWVLVFLVAWQTRDRVRADSSVDSDSSPDTGSGEATGQTSVLSGR